MSLKVLSYNIHKGYSIGNARFVLDGIKAALLDTHADILFLQEVQSRDDRKKSKIPEWPSSNQLEYLADKIWPYTAYGQNVASVRKDYGNAILSRHPIENFENVNITIGPMQNRGLLHADIKLPKSGRRLHLLNVHLDLFARDRLKQVERIILRAEEEIPVEDPIILAGDFNDWETSLTPFFKKHMHLEEAFLKVKGKHANTFPAPKPVLTLDRMYYRNLEIIHAESLSHSPWNRLSDHLAIMCEFKL